MQLVTQLDIKKINELYLKYKTYAAVARETGFSPATVKKYVINGFETVDEATFIRFDRPLPEFDSSIFRSTDWGPLCVLSTKEIEEIRGLWKEIEV